MPFTIQQGSCLPKGSDRGWSGKQETEKRKWFYKSPENIYRWKLIKSNVPCDSFSKSLSISFGQYLSLLFLHS